MDYFSRNSLFNRNFVSIRIKREEPRHFVKMDGVENVCDSIANLRKVWKSFRVGPFECGLCGHFRFHLRLEQTNPYLECGYEFAGRAPHGRHEAALPDEERDGPQRYVDEIQGQPRGGVHILLTLLHFLPEESFQPGRKQPELQKDTIRHEIHIEQSPTRGH